MLPASPQLTPPSLRRAAVAVWIAGGVNVAVFGFCGLVFALSATMLPPSQFAQAAHRVQVSVAEFRMVLWITVALVSLVMIVPGALLLGFGFAARRGRGWALITCAVILLAQAAMVGVLLLLQVVTALAMGRVLGGLMQVALLGPVVALLTWAAIESLRAWQSGDRADVPPEDSWNSPTAVAPW